MSGAAGLPDGAAAAPRPLAGPAAFPARARSGAGRGLALRLAAPWRWLARRTLRGRLIAGLLILLALACAVVGGATYLGLRGFLYGQLDEQLQAAAQRYAAACSHHAPPPPPPAGASGGRLAAARPTPAAATSAARRSTR